MDQDRSDDVYINPDAAYDPADEWAEGQDPTWPKPVGVLSLVFGILAVGCGGLGLAWLGFGQSIMGNVMPADQFPPAMMQLTAAGWVGQILSIVGNVLLITAGAVLLTRQPVARPLHLLYAVLLLVSTALATYAAFEQQQLIAEWVKDNPDAEFSRTYNPTAQALGPVFGGVVALAWPVFCLIWFGLVKTRPEDITGELPPEGYDV